MIWANAVHMTHNYHFIFFHPPSTSVHFLFLKSFNPVSSIIQSTQSFYCWSLISSIIQSTQSFYCLSVVYSIIQSTQSELLVLSTHSVHSEFPLLESCLLSDQKTKLCLMAHSPVTWRHTLPLGATTVLKCLISMTALLWKEHYPKMAAVYNRSNHCKHTMNVL